MSATDVLELEQPLGNWKASIECLRLMADGMDSDTEEKSATLWIADNMERDYRTVKEWFDTTHEAFVAAKGSGPRAVT